jgi:signal transduction histidine kinase
MFRLLSPWIGFVACLAVVLAAMGWISMAAVQADRAEKEARRQAILEQKARVALWRMDTAMARLLAQESARPYFVYRSFYPANRSFNRMYNPQSEYGSLIPSPLLSNRLEEVTLHFQYGPDGRLTSPELPTGANFRLAVPKYLSSREVNKTKRQLADLAHGLDRGRLVKLLPSHELPPVEMVKSQPQGSEQRTSKSLAQGDSPLRGQPGYEYELRNAAVAQNANQMVVQARQPPPFAPPSIEIPATDISGVLMTPLWIDGRLILARRITAEGKEYVQGCVLDWPLVKKSLLETIVDLLPGADLLPSTGASRADESRMLASLPVRLVLGKASSAGGLAASPILISLAAAWACVALAAAAVAALLWGVMRLSQRRAAFVSAVTHELRTPLTTFQMYAEMLTEGMVPDAEQQRHYLGTLRSEATRLTHLVENVLAYARLERGRTAGRIEPVELAELIEGAKARLSAHAEQSGMTLVVEDETAEKYGATTVLANRSAVEQVLFNLVDNACKYAGDAADRRIHLGVGQQGRLASISVADHGPGISAAVRRRLFRSFSKSAEEAAASAPGIGLGLALSRRLARDMGGDLRLDESAAGGARFVLTLPRT